MPAWIFQASPKQFDVNEHLRRPSPRSWLVRPEHFGVRMQRGDRAFIWRSDGGKSGTGGVIAVGQLTGPPEMRAMDPTDFDLRRSEASKALRARDEALRVRIDIEQFRLGKTDGMLLRSWLREQPKLSGLWILRCAARTTYPLSEVEEAELLNAWSRRG